MTVLVFLGSLIGAMMLGMPIAMALLVCGVALMLQLDSFDSQILAQNLIGGADSFPLMAVPFFMLAGELMNAGGLSRRIIALAVTLVGHVRGGLGYVAVLAPPVLASISGSAGADPAALAAIRTGTTKLVVAPACKGKVEGATVLPNGETTTVEGIPIEAVPAYNLVAKRPDGSPFHPKGEGNGYVLTFGKTRVYVAGDTENVPEMKALEGIDVAFLPMNLPYTMTPEMVADAARAFRPRVLYPYHFGETDPRKLVSLLAGEKGIEVRVRKMK